ncbi:hypothetical protein LDHU3_17.2120:CDS1 [Leishmania donovani]|uniref:Hypothetical_protein n=1 Tax=Leishmania donovani TaxID=5661 RepID=A0A3S7WUP3_LEIDO|nr:hypothetical protein LdCL_170021900 [Leishmania donovani]TPP51778.1 hypothetical protein CGC21_4385 [Leishmania donovani]TPP55026.1 hypothetical protein CGC20_37355 [Leishmania donovani]CAJ1987938.1 hypothetical protein LDHU3_17.2120:CDS1 [Leishmania donovani]VDZ43825.1 hypothetical_protein [Leishmania donovani]
MQSKQHDITEHHAETLRRKEDVFARLSRRRPTSLSSPAFEAVVTRLQDEEAQCTFLPRVNHTYDAALMRWAADSDVFTRLSGHAKCQRQQRENAAELKRRADAAEVDEWHAKFRTMPFPRHLYAHARSHNRHTTASATDRIAAHGVSLQASTAKKGTHIISALHSGRRLADGAGACRRTLSEDCIPPAACQGTAPLTLARAEVWLSRMRTAHLSHAHPRSVQEARREHSEAVCEWPKES